MSSQTPSAGTIRSAIDLTGHAPSIHNSQPWRWVMDGDRLQLYADRSRSLPATDPGRRDLLISCGAALHHARVAFAAAGWACHVDLLPDSAHPDHLASIRFSPREPSRSDEALAALIPRRRTDRRRFSSWEVPAGLLHALADRAGEHGALLVAVREPRARAELDELLAEAARRQSADPAYARELTSWTGPGASDTDGIPGSNLPGGQTQTTDTALRTFPEGDLATAATSEVDAGELLVLATSSDDRMSQLRAGQALSAVLLSATDARLGACALSQPVEIDRTRRLLNEDILGGESVAQLILRIGWPPVSAGELPPTPRRSVDEVLTFG